MKKKVVVRARKKPLTAVVKKIKKADLEKIVGGGKTRVVEM
jgi:hypothetical protein